MRVVSLLPAATEIVAALGATAWLVGVSHECDWPPEVRTLPRVTRSSLDAALSSAAIDDRMAAAKREGVAPVTIDRDTLARLAPDVILGQSVCDVCAVGESQLAAVIAHIPGPPRAVTLHAHDLAGVWSDIARVGEALDLAGEAEELVSGLRYRLHRITTSHAPRPTVLVVEWIDPPYVAGHWVPELVAAAGGVDVGARPGDRSVTHPWSALRTVAPDFVVVALCGFDVARARREVAAVTDDDARALFTQARVVFLDGNAYTSRPGPRLVEGTELLAELIGG
ncbi:MAG TPA: ABC transporter substrate-binding protein [Gemmatimonadales bacterium]|jgi:iron complex transport system substrate-binding protein|nr:ABC transporter substrate-binding protein [Gemmatimonadales bacterium]